MTGKKDVFPERRRTAAISAPLAVLCCAAVFSLCCGAVLFLWNGGAFSANRQDRTEMYDMDGDGRMETFSLESRRMKIFADGREIWASDSKWIVEDFILGDLGGDGTEEMVLFVRKRGSYGPVKPFWIKKDETSYSQHIFLYRWNDGGPEPLWMSSRLSPEVREWELLADGSLKLITDSGEDTRWGWHIWGLERLDGETIPF